MHPEDPLASAEIGW